MKGCSAKVVKSGKLAGLRGLLAHFHQDYEIIFDPELSHDFTIFYKLLTLEELVSLKREMTVFLETYGDAKDSTMKGAWFQNGADYWPKKPVALEVLRNSIRDLEKLEMERRKAEEKSKWN